MSARKYSKETAEQVVEHFGSDFEYGLDLHRVAALQREHGPNKLEEEEKVSDYACV